MAVKSPRPVVFRCGVPSSELEHALKDSELLQLPDGSRLDEEVDAEEALEEESLVL